jgi:hypothetical protein
MTTSRGFVGRGGFALGRPIVSFGLGSDGRNNDAQFAPIVVLAMTLAVQASGVHGSLASAVCRATLATSVACAATIPSHEGHVTTTCMPAADLPAELAAPSLPVAATLAAAGQDAPLASGARLQASLPTSRAVPAELVLRLELETTVASPLLAAEVEREGHR